jgi:hypothetical protein
VEVVGVEVVDMMENQVENEQQEHGAGKALGGCEGKEKEGEGRRRKEKEGEREGKKEEGRGK